MRACGGRIAGSACARSNEKNFLSFRRGRRIFPSLFYPGCCGVGSEATIIEIAKCAGCNGRRGYVICREGREVKRRGFLETKRKYSGDRT